MDDDWDLHAVVRGCAAANTSSTPTSSAVAAASFESRRDEDLLCVKDPCEFGAPVNDLHDLYKPFFPALPPPPPSLQDFSPPCAAPISPLSVLGGLQDLSPSHPILNPTIISSPASILQPKKHFLPVNIAPKTSPRTKRRKNQMKRVCQVPAEGLSSDVWSWRKYGQKPIKGSPYPRGYYRCSTSKGCLARKQVERNRSDPNMFIVTYTAEHSHPMPTHRNSLAGSTRQKPTTHHPETSGEGNKLGNSSPGSSPAPEKQESSRDEDKEDICDDEEDGVSNPEMDAAAAAPADDDFFEGLEDLVGDCFPSNLPVSGVQFPWLGNTAETTAAGGG